jgi:hypothetical protein
MPSRPSLSRDESFNWTNRQQRTVPEVPDDSSPDYGLGFPGDDDELSGRELIEVYSALQNAPADSGLDANRWTVGLVQEFLADAYGASYSDEAAQELLEQAQHADT